ncbi:polysaccharide biosynthesis tyrosine autokinase [bacterium]|nr:polysaccharide biosynthesis tyrosine autokinase [bacterium]
MQEHEARTVDLRSYMRALLRKKWLLLIPVLVGGIAGYLISISLSPIYEASTTVVMRTEERLSEPLARLVGRSPVAEQLSRLQERVKSTTFLIELVRALDMADDPGVQEWAEGMHKKDPALTVERYAEVRMVEFLKNRIAVVRTSTNAFRVVVRDLDPDRALLLAQHITNAFVGASNREQPEQIRSVHDFSVQQLVIYRQKLDEAERRLQEYQSSRISGTQIVNPVNQQNVGRVDVLISQAMVEGNDAQQRLGERRSALGVVDGAAYSTLTTREFPTLDALGQELVLLEREVAPALVRSVGNGPEISSLYVSIAEKKDQLRSAARSTAADLVPGASQRTLDAFAELRITMTEVEMVDQRRRTLARFMWDYTQGMASAPEEELEITRLMQEVESNRALYEAFLEQSAAGQITEALEAARAGGRFEVIEPPTRPIAPVAPDKGMIIGLSLLGGLVIGLGLILATEQSDSSFKSVEDVEGTLGLTALATVPNADIFAEITKQEKRYRQDGGRPTDGNPKLLQHLLRETPISFEFRRLTRKIAKSGQGTPKSILVTSSNRGEGKTTTAASLAITLARHHAGSTVLVDCDLRKPRIHRVMEVDNTTGLSDAVVRGYLEESDVKPTSLPNLFVVPAGSDRGEPTRLIETFPESRVMSELLNRFDHVIIDTAPNVAVPDALFIGARVDAVVLVVKAGVTPREVVVRGLELQRDEKMNVIGAVVNNYEHVLPYYYDYKYYGYSRSSTEDARGER